MVCLDLYCTNEFLVMCDHIWDLCISACSHIILLIVHAIILYIILHPIIMRSWENWVAIWHRSPGKPNHSPTCGSVCPSQYNEEMPLQWWERWEHHLPFWFFFLTALFFLGHWLPPLWLTACFSLICYIITFSVIFLVYYCNWYLRGKNIMLQAIHKRYHSQ